MRKLLTHSLLGLSLLIAAACSSDQGKFRSALTGEECEPNDSYVPSLPGHKGEHGNGGQNSPTGIPGDNMDDESSGQIDCLGDGDSGQGNDERKCVPPGCDDQLCCEDDLGDPDGSDDGGEDPGSEDPGSEDPGSEDPGSEDPGSEDPGSEDPGTCQVLCDAEVCPDGMMCNAEGCCEIVVE